MIDYRDDASMELSGSKIPGLPKSSIVTLKRGVCTSDKLNYDGLNSANHQNIERRDVIISLLDEQRVPVMVWKIKHAWPTRIECTDLKSGSTEVAIESMELAHEGWVIQNDLLTPDVLVEGNVSFPPFSAGFPANRIETKMGWDDLVLPESIRTRIEEILHWIRYHQQLQDDAGIGSQLRAGYSALFYGPPGTGKTLTATLLGKSTGREVFRVDLSAVVSKYIGETEKNLAHVFDVAQDRNWILFFDEADALFGKRTEVKDAHDRYANQEVSYLLQRIEEYDGICILASNLRSNIDDAFLRRFSTVINFPIPGPEERMAIWKRALPMSDGVADLIDLVKGYELTGGAIVNATQFAQIEVLSGGRDKIELVDLQLGVRRELEKEGML